MSLANLSLRLSEVLRDISYNEDMLIRRRRATLLAESLITISFRSIGELKTEYIFGSFTEGSRTLCSKSDVDFLRFYDMSEVVANRNDCQGDKEYFLITKDDSTSPGYYLLRKYGHSNYELNSNFIPHHVWEANDGEIYDYHGPAINAKGKNSYNDQDYTIALLCLSWPKAARKWLTDDGAGKWPTKEIKSFAKQNGCFLVPVGSKGSEMEKYEFRISTSLAERALMFSLNITQLRCYIFLKMITKKLGENVISSYICKNVLFHCIKHTPSCLWKEIRLLDCLTLSLSSLQYCVLTENCPHFIIHDNNLLFRRLTTQIKTNVIEKISKIVLSRGQEVLRRVQNVKMEGRPPPSNSYYIGCLLLNTGKHVQDYSQIIIFKARHFNVQKALRHLYSSLSELIRFHKLGSRLERLACKLLAGELSSTIGSLLASYNIMTCMPVSKASLEWFDASLDSNVSSSRLKLASVYYCSGEIEAAFTIIKDVDRRYNIHQVEPVCRCTTQPSHLPREEFIKAAECNNENGLKYVAAYCVHFLRSENKCMPKELLLEMYRTTKAEDILRHSNNRWLDLAFIDSLTFLLFLKYKISGRLGIHKEQIQALQALIRAIRFEPNLGHRETGLNLVGQIMVEKGKLFKALLFFLASHKIKLELNAAKIHICTVIHKLLKQ
ncbi:uncharacterized protein LOC132714261 [Ruditapes philippinarum]|uniref:uncharacterized protein LOC132714261 n=1 Tax=Ruditapes philippinarum TaxID=129788 RepID=UPI00295BC3E3|nr:uncharacterized protein LOC132714261 [Ruditapes philippinarum]